MSSASHANATGSDTPNVPYGTTIAPFAMASSPAVAPLAPYANTRNPDELSLSDLGPLVRQLYAQVRARWLMGLLAAVLVVAAAGWLFFHSPPEFAAQTTLLARSPLDEMLNPGEGGATSPGQGKEENNLRNHLSVMTSRTFLTRVVDSLTPDELTQVAAPYLQAGQTATAVGVLNLLNEKVDIERERGRDFFTITVSHRTPGVAVMLAGAITSQYLAFLQDEYRAAGRAAVTILQTQAAGLSAEILSLEDQRRDYRKQYNLISVEENQSIISERLRRINAALSDVRVQRVGFETQLKQAETDMAVTHTPYNNPVLAAFGNNQQLRMDLDKMRAQVEVYASEFGPNHPKMMESKRVLAGLQQTLENNFQLALSDLRGKLALASAQEQQLNNELTAAFNQSLDIDKLATTFNTLGDQLVAKRKTQGGLLQRISTTLVSGQQSSDVMRIVDPPYLKRASFKRQLMLIGLLGFLGLGAFIGTPLMMHIFDERLSASTDLEAILGKDLLGAVPRLGRTRAEDRAHIVRDNVDFPAVESFLSIIGQLELISKKPIPKRLLVTSTLPGEGKSMMASNLAATFTRLGRRTLLVDCDFRRPTQSVQHQVAEGKGLLTSAMAGFPASDQFFEVNGTLGIIKLPDGTFFLPAGMVDSQPTRHLIAGNMAAVFEQLGGLFDVVVVDTPPAGVFQDALIIAKYCHETVLVARDGKAQTAQIKRIISELEKTLSPVVGLVLNAFAPGATHPQMAYRHLADKYGYGYNNGKNGKGAQPAPAKGSPQTTKV